MTLYRELLHAVRQEIITNPDPNVSGLGMWSQTRQSLQWYFDCYYSGENLIPFSWTDHANDQREDFKVADVCCYKVPAAEIIRSRAPLHQYVLVASGAVLERTGDAGFCTAGADSVGYLLAVVTS